MRRANKTHRFGNREIPAANKANIINNATVPKQNAADGIPEQNPAFSVTLPTSGALL